MTEENYNQTKDENEPEDDEISDYLPFFDLTPEHQAVLALRNALLVKWDEVEEGLQELGEESPLVSTMLCGLSMFSHSHPLLVENDQLSQVAQFGPTLHAFSLVAERIEDLLGSDEFAAAQWGCFYAFVQDKLGIPAAVTDTFDLKWGFDRGFSVEGIKPLFVNGALIPEAWGAAHHLVESGDYEPVHLEHLPRPDDSYFFSEKSAC